MHWRRKWQPTPVFLFGESQGRGSLVGCRLWGHTESDTTEVTWQQQHPFNYVCFKNKQNETKPPSRQEKNTGNKKLNLEGRGGFLWLLKNIYLAVLGLSCSMWDLVPWRGINEPRTPALGSQSLSPLDHQGSSQKVEVLFQVILQAVRKGYHFYLGHF